MPQHVCFASPEAAVLELPDNRIVKQEPALMVAINTRSSWLYAVIAFSIMALTSVWLVLTTRMPLPEHRITAVNPSPCGATAAEATARGCRFDIMSFSWLAPACFDGELTREFEAGAGSARWFVDQNATWPVARADVLRGEADLFVSARYHRRHCTFMWKKLHRAVARGGPVDGYIANYNHTLHCERMLLMEGDDDAGAGALNTRIFRKFPSCEPSRGQLANGLDDKPLS